MTTEHYNHFANRTDIQEYFTLKKGYSYEANKITNYQKLTQIFKLKCKQIRRENTSPGHARKLKTRKTNQKIAVSIHNAALHK